MDCADVGGCIGGTGEGTASAASSILCGGGRICELSRWLARSAIVSVAVVKMGGLFFQPMGNTSGKATSFSWPGSVGKATPSFGMSSIFMFTR